MGACYSRTLPAGISRTPSGRRIRGAEVRPGPHAQRPTPVAGSGTYCGKWTIFGPSRDGLPRVPEGVLWRTGEMGGVRRGRGRDVRGCAAPFVSVQPTLSIWGPGSCGATGAPASDIVVPVPGTLEDRTAGVRHFGLRKGLCDRFETLETALRPASALYPSSYLRASRYRIAAGRQPAAQPRRHHTTAPSCTGSCCKPVQ